MSDELFPNVPAVVSKVATSHTMGGECDHCGQLLKRGKPVHKLAPHCCRRHQRRHRRGANNGPGNWVCTTCAIVLVTHD